MFKRLWKQLTGMDRRQRLRYGLMVLGILALVPPVGFIVQLFGGSTICGPLCGRMAIGTALPREIVTRTAGVGLLGIWLGTTLFAGRWFCSHLCPVGGLTEFGSKLLPRKAKIDYSKHVDTPLFRYGFLGAFIALPILGVGSICCSYCNLSTIPETFGAIFNPGLRPMLTTGYRLLSAGIFVGALGVLARDGRGHCHMLCPIGALDSIMSVAGSKLPFGVRERIHSDKCVGCGLCVQECPTWAISMSDTLKTEKGRPLAQISYHRCNQCRKCEAECPKDAIGLGRPERRPQA